jgi:hypothetical protein
MTSYCWCSLSAQANEHKKLKRSAFFHHSLACVYHLSTHKGMNMTSYCWCSFSTDANEHEKLKRSVFFEHSLACVYGAKACRHLTLPLRSHPVHRTPVPQEFACVEYRHDVVVPPPPVPLKMFSTAAPRHERKVKRICSSAEYCIIFSWGIAMESTKGSVSECSSEGFLSPPFCHVLHKIKSAWKSYVAS